MNLNQYRWVCFSSAVLAALLLPSASVRAQIASASAPNFRFAPPVEVEPEVQPKPVPNVTPLVATELFTQPTVPANSVEPPAVEKILPQQIPAVTPIPIAPAPVGDPVRIVHSTTTPLLSIDKLNRISTITNTATIQAEPKGKTKANQYFTRSEGIGDSPGFTSRRPVYMASELNNAIEVFAIVEDEKGQDTIVRAELPVEVEATAVPKVIVGMVLAQNGRGQVIATEASKPLVAENSSLDIEATTELTPAPETDVKSTQTGQASWYGPEGGPKTANGERYNPQALTAAHRTLPFGTKVRVTNIKNGQVVTVRINDRGPFAKKRIIDLSEAAAAKIGIKSTGVGQVQVEVLTDSTAE
jgi:rare lipoprotein A (peptidoglycan hydrolase)